MLNKLELEAAELGEYIAQLRQVRIKR